MRGRGILVMALVEMLEFFKGMPSGALSCHLTARCAEASGLVEVSVDQTGEHSPAG